MTSPVAPPPLDLPEDTPSRRRTRRQELIRQLHDLFPWARKGSRMAPGASDEVALGVDAAADREAPSEAPKGPSGAHPEDGEEGPPEPELDEGA